MAITLYGKARQYYSFPSIVTDDIKVVLADIRNGHYAISANSDRYLSDIALADRIAISGVLTGKSFTNGLFVANNFTYGVLAAGNACGALVIFHDSGDASTSDLLMYVDSYPGLPVTPDGLQEVPVIWPSAGIFLL